MEKFNVRLKEAMTLRGISQTELCQLTNIPKSAVSQYLSGNFKPKQTRTYILSEVLRVSPAWLMGYDVPRRAVDKNTTNDDSEVIVLFNELDPEDKAEIRGEIKQMLKADKYKTHYTLPPFEADKNNELRKAAMKTPSQPQVKKKPKTT